MRTGVQHNSIAQTHSLKYDLAHWPYCGSDEFGLDGISIETRGCGCLLAFVDEEEETAKNRTALRE